MSRLKRARAPSSAWLTAMDDALDAVISGDEAPVPPAPRPVGQLRLALPRGTFLTEDMDATVAAAFVLAGNQLDAAARACCHVYL